MFNYDNYCQHHLLRNASFSNAVDFFISSDRTNGVIVFWEIVRTDSRDAYLPATLPTPAKAYGWDPPRSFEAPRLEPSTLRFLPGMDLIFR